MIYFDHAATTRVLPEAAQAAMKTMTEDYGNPSSLYQLGVQAAKRMGEHREQVARALGCQGAPRRRSIPISAPLRRILSMPGCAGSERNSACISRADLPHTEEKRRPLWGAAIRERKVPGRRGNTR